MRIVVILVLAIMILVWIVQGLRCVFARRDTLWQTILTKLGGAFIIIGAIGFFGTAAASIGLLDGLPETLEWPLNGTYSAVTFPSGEYAVAHENFSRIQLYAESGEFIRGFQVRTQGAVDLYSSENSTILVYSHRSKREYEYDLFGSLQSSSNSSDQRPVSFTVHTEKVFSASPLLWPLTGPLPAWIVCGLGIGMLVLSRNPAAK